MMNHPKGSQTEQPSTVSRGVQFSSRLEGDDFKSSPEGTVIRIMHDP